MQTVHLFVFDGLSDWEPGFAVAGLNQPPAPGDAPRFRVATVGPTDAPVRTMGGLRVVPDGTLAQLDPRRSAMLILPGGTAWEAGGSDAAVAAARAFLDAGVPVAAICGATFGLARAGLLDDRRHTSNAREYLAQSGYRGGALYQDEPAVTDRDLITASGVMPVDFARAIFARLELFPPRVLTAWYGLYKTGEARYFHELVAGASPTSA
jgi:putative intracellular protease/amidase